MVNVNARRGRPTNASKAQAVREEPRQDPHEDRMEIPENSHEIESIRPSMREEDPRARAARRAAELRGNAHEEYDGVDEFYIDSSIVPDGWSYEWKTKFIFNQEQQSSMMAYRQGGWEEVPTSRHPNMMPLGSEEPFIIRKGMVLMERPSEITAEARQREARKAAQQVSGKEAQLNSAGSGEFARTGAKVSKSYSAMPIPND